MRVLVTGGGGFLGSHLADALVARGDAVAVVDDLSAGRPGRVPAQAAMHKLSVTDAAAPPDLHLTARQAAEHAVRADVGEVVLTHLVPWNDAAVSQEQAAEVFAGRLRLASPGLRLLGGQAD